MTTINAFDRDAWLDRHGAREPRTGGWPGPLARVQGARFAWCSIVIHCRLTDDGRTDRGWKLEIKSSPGGDESYRGWTVGDAPGGWTVRDPSGVVWRFRAQEFDGANPWSQSPRGQWTETVSGSLTEP